MGVWISSCFGLSHRVRPKPGPLTPLRGIQKEEEKAVLPLDLVVEILALLPVKTLIKFRCVCNQWRNLFLDPTFVRLQAKRSKPLNFTLDENQIIISCFCNGLLCVINQKEKRDYACNPAMHQNFAIPPMGPGVFSYNATVFIRVSCVPSTGEHKVVAETQEDPRCLVLLLGGPSSTWKDLGVIPNHCGGHKLYLAVNVDGFLHWVFTNDVTGDVNVVSLDLGSENFNVHIGPIGLSKFAVDNYPMKWEGCFAICRFVGKKMMVWVLRDLKKQIWEEGTVWLTCLNLELGGKNFRPSYKKKESQGITFVKDPREYYNYNMVTNRTLPMNANTISYKPSLVSCNGISGHDGPMPEWFRLLLSKLKL